MLETARQFYFGNSITGPDGTTGGDPVDLATGLLTLQKTDLILPGRTPISITRSFRTNGPQSGPFGRGTTFPYSIALGVQGDQRVVGLADGKRFTFTKQPDGRFLNLTDAAMQGAVITEPSGVPTLRWKDGAVWMFIPPQFPVLNIARLAGMQDRNGHGFGDRHDYRLILPGHLFCLRLLAHGVDRGDGDFPSAQQRHLSELSSHLFCLSPFPAPVVVVARPCLASRRSLAGRVRACSPFPFPLGSPHGLSQWGRHTTEELKRLPVHYSLVAGRVERMGL